MQPLSPAEVRHLRAKLDAELCATPACGHPPIALAVDGSGVLCFRCMRDVLVQRDTVRQPGDPLGRLSGPPPAVVWPAPRKVPKPPRAPYPMDACKPLFY